jgi:hypothetical protein
MLDARTEPEAQFAEEVEGPTECGDPACGGHVDENTGCCVLCEMEHTSPCRACEGYGFHVGGCPDGVDYMDFGGEA